MRTDLFLEIVKEHKKKTGNVKIKEESIHNSSKVERQRRWILGLEGGCIE